MIYVVLYKNIKPYYPVAPHLIEQFVLEHVEGLSEAIDEQMVASGFKARTGLQAIATIRHQLGSIAWAHRNKTFKGHPESAG